MMEAEPRKVGGEARVGNGHAEVGPQREAEPAADRRALHCGDHRRARGEQAHRLVVEVVPDRAEADVAREVCARAEVLAVRREYGGARSVGVGNHFLVFGHDGIPRVRCKDRNSMLLRLPGQLRPHLALHRWGQQTLVAILHSLAQ